MYCTLSSLAVRLALAWYITPVIMWLAAHSVDKELSGYIGDSLFGGPG